MASSVFFAALSGLVSVTASRAFCNVNHLLLSVRYQSIGLLVSHLDLHVPSGPCRGWGLPVFSFPHGRLPGFCLLSFPFNFLHRRVCVAWALSPTFPSSCPTPEFCHLCPLVSRRAAPHDESFRNLRAFSVLLVAPSIFSPVSLSPRLRVLVSTGPVPCVPYPPFCQAAPLS